MKDKSIIFISVFLYLSAFFTVFASALIKGYENFLSIATKENGFFESISALLLFIMAIYGFVWIYKNSSVKRWLLICVGLFSFLCLIASLEEISWGQHIFHFSSGEYFKTHNNQHETNMHNLIPSEIFSSIIYFAVYTFYVFMPLFLRLLAKKQDKLKHFLSFIPPLHVTLMILFASSFQIYFYDDFGVLADMITLLVGVILFIIVAKITSKIDKLILLHFSFVMLSIAFFMYSHKVFDFFNNQYEIREMFVVLATFIYFSYFLSNFKKI